MPLSIPLKFDNQHGFERETHTTESIKQFIELLVSCHLGVCSSNPSFGFIFKNCRFENFDEKKGSIATPENTDIITPSHTFKIKGNSGNFNTFARELKEQLSIFEPRLRDINIKMEYYAVTKKIELKIKGFVIDKTIEKFEHTIFIHVW